MKFVFGFLFGMVWGVVTLVITVVAYILGVVTNGLAEGNYEFTEGSIIPRKKKPGRVSRPGSVSYDRPPYNRPQKSEEEPAA